MTADPLPRFTRRRVAAALSAAAVLPARGRAQRDATPEDTPEAGPGGITWPEILADIEHAPTHVPVVKGVHEAWARWLGHKVQADLHITLPSHWNVAESHDIVDRVQAALADHVPAFGGAVIHVCPASEDLQTTAV